MSAGRAELVASLREYSELVAYRDAFDPDFRVELEGLEAGKANIATLLAQADKNPQDTLMSEVRWAVYRSADANAIKSRTAACAAYKNTKVNPAGDKQGANTYLKYSGKLGKHQRRSAGSETLDDPDDATKKLKDPKGTYWWGFYQLKKDFKEFAAAYGKYLYFDVDADDVVTQLPISEHFKKPTLSRAASDLTVTEVEKRFRDEFCVEVEMHDKLDRLRQTLVSEIEEETGAVDEAEGSTKLVQHLKGKLLKAESELANQVRSKAIRTAGELNAVRAIAEYLTVVRDLSQDFVQIK